MRILYVEDNEVNRALVERVLRAKKCSAVFREDGEGSLEILANDPEIDLILLDIELASSMTGLDVIRAMRARNDHRPVVAITAYAMMGDRERFLEAGCDQYLPKPLVITDLLNMIDEVEAQIMSKAGGAPSTVPSVLAPAASDLTPDSAASATEQKTARATTPTLMPAVKPSNALVVAAPEAVSQATSTSASECSSPEQSPTKDAIP